VLGRFFRQIADLVSAMQRKIYSGDNLAEAKRIYDEKQEARTQGLRLVPSKIWELLQKVGKDLTGMAEEPTTEIADKEAVACIVSLLEKGLSIEEIAYLANEPASNNVADSSEERDQSSIQFLEANRDNPMVDQKESTRLRAEIIMGKDRAARVCLKDVEDPNEKAMQGRQQTMEFAMMQQGMIMEVASVDNHAVHRATLDELAQPFAQATFAAPTPEAVQSLLLMVDHAQTHVDMDPQLTETQKEELTMMNDQFRAQIEQAQAAMQAQADATGMPPGAVPPTAPPQITIQDQLSAEDQAHRHEMERAQFERDTQLSEREQARKDEELRLKQEQNAQGIERDRIAQSTEATRLVMDEAARTREAASREAEAERKAIK
jgi:hypothetical protein